MPRPFEQRLSMFDLVPEGVCVVRNDRTIVFLNRAMRQRFGNLVGKRCFESELASPEMCDNCPIGPDMESAQYPQRRVVRMPSGKMLEVTANLLDEHDASGSFLVSIVHDLTEFADAQAHALRLAFSMDQLSEAIALFDLEGKIVYVNRPFALMLGTESEEMIGRPLSEVAESSRVEIPVRKMVANGRSFGWSEEVPGVGADGTKFYYHLDVRPVRDTRGNVLALVSTLRDVTREHAEKVETARYRSQLEKRMEERTRELAHRVNQLTTINKISRAVTSIFNQETLLQEFANLLAGGFDYHIVSIMLWDKDRAELRFMTGAGPGSTEVRRDRGQKLKEGIIGHAAYFMETLVTGDVDADPRYFRMGITRTKSEVAVPLAYRGELLGVLDIQSDMKNAFTKNDVTVLEMLADILSTAMVNARAFSELRDRENAFSILDKISKQISMRLEPKVVIDQVARDAAQLLNAEKALVGLVNPERDYMNWMALYNVEAETMEKLRKTVAAGVTGRVLKRMTAEVVNDYVSDPDAVKEDQDVLGIRSMVSAPLVSGGKAVGVINVYNRFDDSGFKKSDAILLSSLADHAAIALENANLLSDLNMRVQSQLTLLETAVSIQRQIDSSSIYQTVADRLEEVVWYDSITVYKVDHERKMMVPVVAKGRNAEEILQDIFPVSEGVSGHVAMTGTAEIVNNTLADDRAVLVAGTDDDLEEEALMAVPLKGRDRILGVLTLYRETGGTFSTTDRDIAQLFANQAAVAVENFELYNKTEQLLEESQRKVLQMAKVLEVTTSVMYMGELETVLQRVTDAVVESFGFRRATISLLDPAKGLFTMVSATGFPEWVKRGSSFEGEVVIEAMVEANRMSETCYFVPYEKQDFGVDRFYFLAHPELADRPRESPDAWHERDIIMFALRDHSNHLIGYMLADEPDDLKVPRKEHLEVLEILAGMASIAIVNSRLYRRQVDAVNEIALLNDLMTHDINNFNQGVMGYVELLLQDSNLEEGPRKYAERALVQVRNNARLIDNMRTLAKVRAMSEKGFTPQDLGRTIELATDTVVQAHTGREIVVNSQVRTGRHFVLANPFIRDLFVNLLSNAVKFDSSDRVRIDVGISTDQGSGGDYWLLTVTDRGRGIANDRKKAVFERFATGMTGIKGFGLGLSIVSTMVDKFGGKIWVEDRILGDHTKGAVFKMLLPKADLATQPHR